MEKWFFNSLLINKLSDILDLSGAEIARRCGLSQQVMNRYMNNGIVLSVQTLLKICNSIRMPIYYFVAEDNNFVLPNREYATIAHDLWQPVGWNHSAVERIFGDKSGQIAWRDVATAMGVTPQKPHDRMLLKTRLPVDDFCRTCNNLNLSPFTFLIDRNRDVGNKKRRSTETTTTKSDGSSTNNELFSQEIADLHQNIAKLNSTIENLTCRYKSLLERHNQLEQTVIRYISHRATEGIAAEPDEK